MYIICMQTFRSTVTSFLLVFSLILLSGNVLSQERSAFEQLMEQMPKQTAKKAKINPSALKIARLHYSGGGDWYWGRSSVPNMLTYLRDNTDFPVDTIEHEITINDPELFKYPFLFATGHGIISFEPDELERLRQYLAGGGFLFVNDSYGMKKTFPKEMAKIFPEREIVEVPFDHPLYHCFYDFPNGPPKIHEHDNQAPRGYAIIVNGRVVVYFLIESDIGDGWEDQEVHNDPQEKRLEALKMGVNLITYGALY